MALSLTGAVLQVQQQKQEWAALARQLDRYLAAAGITEQQLFWALSIARSRAFAAPYAAAPLSTAPKLFGAAQVVAAAAWLAQGAGGAWAAELLGAAAAAALGFTLLQQRETQQQHVMCPLLDMFNHDGQEQVSPGRACPVAGVWCYTSHSTVPSMTVAGVCAVGQLDAFVL